MFIMRIGGFIKQSLIDWEGKVTSVIFTKGCNFRCGYCHNPYLVLPELIRQTRDMEEVEILNFLSKRRHWLDGVVISGGEPTLQKDLPDFTRRIKEFGLPVKLDTNGSNPDILKQLIRDRSIDCIAMDIKSVLSPPCYQKVNYTTNASLLEKIKQSIQIIKHSGLEYQFRTTVIPQVQTPEEIENLKEQFADSCYIIQEFRDGDILDNHLLINTYHAGVSPQENDCHK